MHHDTAAPVQHDLISFLPIPFPCADMKQHLSIVSQFNIAHPAPPPNASGELLDGGVAILMTHWVIILVVHRVVVQVAV